MKVLFQFFIVKNVLNLNIHYYYTLHEHLKLNENNLRSVFKKVKKRMLPLLTTLHNVKYTAVVLCKVEQQMLSCKLLLQTHFQLNNRNINQLCAQNFNHSSSSYISL